jgi:hypothetical protein
MSPIGQPARPSPPARYRLPRAEYSRCILRVSDIQANFLLQQHDHPRTGLFQDSFVAFL